MNDFIEYVRTLMFWRLRLKNTIERTGVYVPMTKVKQFIPTNTRAMLAELVSSGDLQIIEHENNDKKYFIYEALKAGCIVPHLLEPKGAALTPLHVQMMHYLLHTELPNDSEATLFFQVFQKLKSDFLRLFFTVDQFCGRVHTPFTNLHRPLRKHLIFYGNPVSSLDVAQMQPTILGKILFEKIGTNEFSEWLNEGKDIYTMLQQKANLETRDQGKKRFFEILFSKPNNSLASLFGDANWINWINEIKSKPMEANPHGTTKPHSNLAYLLQSTEVKIMAKVWQQLASANMPFLSIHDEIIVQSHHINQAGKIFNKILSKEFSTYKLNSKAGSQALQHPAIEVKTETPIKAAPQWDVVELEAFFSKSKLPVNPIRLNQCEVVTDVKKFVETHLKTVKNNNGKPAFKSHFERLALFRELLAEKN